LHRELLPDDLSGLDAEGRAASIHPYQVQTHAGEPVFFDVEVRNPFTFHETAEVRMVVPAGWQVQELVAAVALGRFEVQTVQFRVTPPEGLKTRRARVAIDLTVGTRRLGQQAEALVTVI
jgi:hypothetical protein